MFAVEPANDQAVFLEVLQPGGQDVRRQPVHRFLEVLKAASTLQEQIPEDQKRPALANEVERPRDRAVSLSIRPGHNHYHSILTSVSQVNIILKVVRPRRTPMNPTSPRTALITGASSGIGREFA